MIWNIVLWSIGVILAIFALIVFSPWYLEASLHIKNSSSQFSFNTCWIHPLFFKAFYDFESNCFTISIFGRMLVNKKENSIPGSHDDTIEKTVTYEAITDDKSHEESTIVNKTVFSANSDQSTPLNTKKKSTFNKKIEDDDAEKDKKKNESTQKKKSDSDKKAANQKTKENKKGWLEKIKRNPFIFFILHSKCRSKCLCWIIKIFKCTFKIVRIQSGNLLVCAGFEDYAATGKLFGYIEGIRHALSLYSKKVQLQYQPLFVNGQSTINGEIKISSSPFKIISPLLLAATTFPYLTLLITWLEFRQSLKKGNSNAKCS